MSSSTTLRPLAVIAGIGNGAGTGAASARLFARQGYSIALIARSRGDSLTKLANEIKETGGDAAAFPIPSYAADAVASAFAGIRAHFSTASYILRVAIFNATHLVYKPFLEVTPEDVHLALENNTVAAFAFSHAVISEFKVNPLNAEGKRGTLIFTGATASIRGSSMFSAFSAGHSAKRALAQSLAKEFGKDNIHVCSGHLTSGGDA
ncbi:hypothetical protein Ac2012v2_003215 [Leucoagaricus gongylophorus]